MDSSPEQKLLFEEMVSLLVDFPTTKNIRELFILYFHLRSRSTDTTRDISSTVMRLADPES